MNPILDKYAALLVDYCLALKPGDRLFLRSTTLAVPLLREVYRHALDRGARVSLDLAFEDQEHLFYAHASDAALDFVDPNYAAAMSEYEAYLFIRAPFNLREDSSVPAERRSLRQKALSRSNEDYFRRAATRELRRCLCQFPTAAAAQNAGMALNEYERFVYEACQLFQPQPQQAWLDVRERQQHIVDHLNRCTQFRYLNARSDIRFSAKGRRWINSDGQTNMPSGEVYTSPVEDSVEGHVHFDYPAVYMGHEVEGVTLHVKDGWITHWEARRGQEFLDRIFQTEGARRFGEAAIGTNAQIRTFTRNILFDEKIGGTIHMAIGQSYPQAGGKNQSAIHWDMIADMTQGGEIWADGQRIYENGRFLI